MVYRIYGLFRSNSDGLVAHTKCNQNNYIIQFYLHINDALNRANQNNSEYSLLAK